jgi:hypothetical protein
MTVRGTGRPLFGAPGLSWSAQHAHPRRVLRRSAPRGGVPAACRRDRRGRRGWPGRQGRRGRISALSVEDPAAVHLDRPICRHDCSLVPRVDRVRPE